MDTIVIALIQLAHQMSLKSVHKPLMGYEALMYEKLCDFTGKYAVHLTEQLKRSQDERSSKTEGGSP
jgi:hypothetical protein